MDIFSKEKRSDIMSRIKSKNTKPEIEVFRYLSRRGIYFQKHYKNAPGKPDIALPRKKIAIFVDGGFWHGYQFAKWESKLSEFWKSKIKSNIRRDRRNYLALKKKGWRVLRVWQHQLIIKNREKAFLKIESFLKQK